MGVADVLNAKTGNMETEIDNGTLINKQYSTHDTAQINFKPNFTPIINPEIPKQYSIVFNENNDSKNLNSNLIFVKNRRDIELFLLCLGDEASVIMDEQAREEHPDIWNWLFNHTYSDVFTDLKWSYREEIEVLDIIQRIPLPKLLKPCLTSYEEPKTGLIDKKYVHKLHHDCVLISNPFQCGNIFYFNGFVKSSEFNIDHYSDHLEGIVIFEVARQAGIASVHLAGLPLTGTITILKVYNHYTKFIQSSEPYLIRVIPVIKQRGGYSYGVYNIIQNGKSCVLGYFTGMVYKSKESYKKFRHSRFID